MKKVKNLCEWAEMHLACTNEGCGNEWCNQCKAAWLSITRPESLLAQDTSKCIEELRIALDESLKLQRNYAELLNMYDGGKRRVFDSANTWIKRLRKIGKLTAT